MNIGLDLSVLQTNHRMRGVGAVAKEFFNNLPDRSKKNDHFILFLYANDQNLALDVLHLEGVDYEVRTINHRKSIHFKFPWKFKKINGLLNSIQEFYQSYFGEKKFNPNQNLDSYIQFDQLVSLPKLRHSKKILVLYDIIPYVLKDDYLWDYKTARRNGLRYLSSFRRAYLRRLYILKLKANTRRADTLIAISKHTKNDFINYLRVPSQKINIVYLGAPEPENMQISYPGFKKYTKNSWGHSKQDVNLQEKPFLLFMGGIDPRRKIIDLVAAYNMLRAQGHDIRLVLAGDILMGTEYFPTIEAQEYIASSSYLEDIIFLGYVDDYQRSWLYQNTLAFVYPSAYEGFGLPVLEALAFRAPVITYNNSSLREITNKGCILVGDYLGIQKSISTLLNQSKKTDTSKVNSEFKWSKTASEIIRISK